nr:reverse transcriptase domain-containing protein [Tanacetum cinerariifolium]
YTIKVPPPLVQKAKPPSQRNFVVHQRDPLHPNIPYPSRMLEQKQQEKVEVQIHKFWQMFKQLHINITLADALILIPKYQKMLKALLSNKEKRLELANTPLNENCSAVILKKLPEKLGDPGKFLIPCVFSELKCKALANLGTSINLMPLSFWKKLGLLELISTCMTLKLANRAICTPTGIARDVFVPVGKFTFPHDFFIVDYESDPRVLLILGRPFLRTALALIDVHGEEMILRNGDKRLTLNMRHDTSSYSNQPKKESINLINVFNDSSEDYLIVLFATHQSGNPTFSSHPKLTSPEVKDDVFDPEGGNVLTEKLLDLDSTKDLHPPHNVNPLNGSTTSPSSPNKFLEEFANELTLITFPPYLADLNDNLVDTMPEMFTDKHALDYLSHPLYDEYDDDIFENESDTEYVYDDPFDFRGEKIKDSKLLIDEFDLPNKNVKKLAISHASLILEDLDLPLNELPSFKEVHSFLIPELSHQFYKVFKINKILKSPMKIFLFSRGENIRILDVPCLHFYPLDQLKYEGDWVKLSDPKQALCGRHPMLILVLVMNKMCLLCVVV